MDPIEYLGRFLKTAWLSAFSASQNLLFALFLAAGAVANLLGRDQANFIVWAQSWNLAIWILGALLAAFFFRTPYVMYRMEQKRADGFKSQLDSQKSPRLELAFDTMNQGGQFWTAATRTEKDEDGEPYYTPGTQYYLRVRNRSNRTIQDVECTLFYGAAAYESMKFARTNSTMINLHPDADEFVELSFHCPQREDIWRELLGDDDTFWNVTAQGKDAIAARLRLKRDGTSIPIFQVVG